MREFIEQGQVIDGEGRGVFDGLELGFDGGFLVVHGLPAAFTGSDAKIKRCLAAPLAAAIRSLGLPTDDFRPYSFTILSEQAGSGSAVALRANIRCRHLLRVSTNRRDRDWARR